MSEILLQLDKVSCIRNGTNILTSISFSLHAGEWLTLAGHNGSGKSTLLRLLLGLERPSLGQILWRGQPLKQQLAAMRQQLGVVLQHPEDQMLGQTLLHDVAFGLPLTQRQNPHWQQMQRHWLEHFDLWRLRHLSPAALSGGQRSMLALTVAILRQPQFLVLDEPFASLDYAALKLCVAALVEQHKNGVALLLIAHQLEPFLAHCQRLLLLRNGCLLCDATPALALKHAEAAGVRVPTVPIAQCSWLGY